MVLERIRKAHELLFELENVRYTLVTIGTLINPHLTESYEAELMEKLIETEALLDRIKDCLSKQTVNPPLSITIRSKADFF